MLEVLLGDERLELMRDKWPVSPLDVAVCARSLAICRRLLQDGRVDPSLNGTPSPLHRAVERGYSEIMQTLLSHRSVDPGIENDSVWPCARSFAIVKEPPLDVEMANGSDEIVRMLEGI
jgi:ankyrin repeat protein